MKLGIYLNSQRHPEGARIAVSTPALRRPHDRLRDLRGRLASELVPGPYDMSAELVRQDLGETPQPLQWPVVGLWRGWIGRHPRGVHQGLAAQCRMCVSLF